MQILSISLSWYWAIRRCLIIVTDLRLIISVWTTVLNCWTVFIWISWAIVSIAAVISRSGGIVIGCIALVIDWLWIGVVVCGVGIVYVLGWIWCISVIDGCVIICSIIDGLIGGWWVSWRISCICGCGVRGCCVGCILLAGIAINYLF